MGMRRFNSLVCSCQIFNCTCFFYEFILWVARSLFKNCIAAPSGVSHLKHILCQFSNTPIFIIIVLSFIAIIAAYLVYISAAASGAGLAGNVDQKLMDKEAGEF